MLFLETLQRWRKEQRDIETLRAMSNRQLADLGITRGEIAARVRRKT